MGIEPARSAVRHAPGGPDPTSDEEIALAKVLQRRNGTSVPIDPGQRPRTTWRQDLVTAVLSFWMVAGVASDGWAHIHQQLDTFFTPWHGIMYSGYAALAAWMIWLVRPTPGSPGLARRIPVGYGLGLVGAGFLLFTAVADGVWHAIFGIEATLEAMLSPTHLIGFVGALLMYSSPLRGEWVSPRLSERPALREFLPILLSLSATTTVITVFLGGSSAFIPPPPIQAVDPAAPLESLDAYVIGQGWQGIMLNNLMLLAPLLLAYRRWRLPFGSATIFLTIPVVMAVAVWDLGAAYPLLLAPIAGGLVADWLTARSPGTAFDRGTHRLVATATPLAMWLVYVLVLQLRFGIVWSAELWTGTVIFTVLAGYALHLLTALPGAAPSSSPIPLEAEATRIMRS
jgi:hypothetical protein